MTVGNIKKTTRKEKKERKVTSVTKHIEKYLTTQFQTQAMNIDYTDLHNHTPYT